MATTDLDGDTPSAADAGSLARLAHDAVEIALAGDIKRGLALALSASQRAREAGDKRAELAALNAAARCHSLRNDSINSLAAGIDAAALARALGDGVALGHALCAIVNTAFTLRLLTECEAFVVRAIDEALAHHDVDLEYRARQGYGVLLGDLERFDEARAQLDLAVAAAQTDGRTALLLRVEGNRASLSRKIAVAHATRGEQAAMQAAASTALAEAAAVLAHDYARQVLSVEMNMTNLMAELHALVGDVDRGIEETGRAIEMARRARHPAMLPPLAIRMGELLRARGRLPEAVAAIQQGLDAAETLRPTFRMAELCAAMATVRSALGDDIAAAEWQRRAQQEQAQFESGRLLAAGFLKRLQAELTAESRA